MNNSKSVKISNQYLFLAHLIVTEFKLLASGPLMGNCGKPSRACRTCKQRRIKVSSTFLSHLLLDRVSVVSIHLLLVARYRDGGSSLLTFLTFSVMESGRLACVAGRRIGNVPAPPMNSKSCIVAKTMLLWQKPAARPIPSPCRFQGQSFIHCYLG